MKSPMAFLSLLWAALVYGVAQACADLRERRLKRRLGDRYEGPAEE